MTEFERKLNKAKDNTQRWKLLETTEAPKERQAVLIAILQDARNEGECLKVADKAPPKSMLEGFAYQKAREARIPSLKSHL